jgi:hypothetical protein
VKPLATLLDTDDTVTMLPTAAVPDRSVALCNAKEPDDPVAPCGTFNVNEYVELCPGPPAEVCVNVPEALGQPVEPGVNVLTVNELINAGKPGVPSTNAGMFPTPPLGVSVNVHTPAAGLVKFEIVTLPLKTRLLPFNVKDTTQPP